MENTLTISKDKNIMNRDRKTLYSYELEGKKYHIIYGDDTIKTVYSKNKVIPFVEGLMNKEGPEGTVHYYDETVLHDIDQEVEASLKGTTTAKELSDKICNDAEEAIAEAQAERPTDTVLKMFQEIKVGTKKQRKDWLTILCNKDYVWLKKQGHIVNHSYGIWKKSFTHDFFSYQY